MQFLANREAHLHFAVLSDFTDAPTETRPGRRRDPRGRGRRACDALNARYARGRAGRVLPLPPPAPLESAAKACGWAGSGSAASSPSSTASCRGGARGASPPSSATSTLLRGVRYVITLDADTVLPPDAAPLLVGALAHPLNRAVYDPAARPRGAGYGILQPRVGVSLPSAHRSRFAAIHSGHPGVDPYTTAVSDVYQDLYGEGSFTGKGIYDVDAFERATHGRFPENTLLSHDLIEGNYARAGLATDIDGLRRLPDALPHLHPPQAPLDPRRLAAPALARARGCRAPTAPSPTGSRCSRAGRSSTTCAAALVEIAQLRLPRRRLDGASRLAAPLDRCSALGAIAAPWIVVARCSRCSGRRSTSRWRAYYAAVGARRGHQHAAARARDRLPAAPGVDLGRRDRAHALADARLPAAPARVADRLADRAHGVRRRPRRLARDVARRGARRRLARRVGRGGC